MDERKIRGKAGWGWTKRAGVTAVAVSVIASMVSSAAAQEAQTPPATKENGKPPAGVSLPAGYVIGPEDALTVVFWRDKELSADVVVRPDGKISLPLLNDIQAAGYTPEQLGDVLVKAA